MAESPSSPGPGGTLWHRCSADEAYALLDSSREGLSTAEAERRQAQHGPNLLDEAPPRSLPAIFAAQFADFMIVVLLGAAVISGVVGDLTDALIITAIILLNAVLGFFQEYRAERAMAALKAMAALSAAVIRDGHPSTIPAEKLVPGDVVLVEAGRVLPAD